MYDDQCKEKVPFDCNSLKKEMHWYYHNKGEWHGIYTMEIEKVVEERVGTCHAKYKYESISYPKDIGYDFRVFKMHLDGKTCSWKVVYMGPYLSGKLAFD
jgi:hypothetical protein